MQGFKPVRAWGRQARTTPAYGAASTPPRAMFEAEIKYMALGSFEPPGRRLPDAIYKDVYFDAPDGLFYASGQELRLREADGSTTLTYKRPPFDAATSSKEELETGVADPEAMRKILMSLGFVQRLAFTKRCRRFQDEHDGFALNIAVVSVDFAPETFVEIEHLATTFPEGRAALPIIRAYAASLGLSVENAVCYTDFYLAARRNAGCASPAKEKEPL
jgi:adenylate cyclase, class 2